MNQSQDTLAKVVATSSTVTTTAVASNPAPPMSATSVLNAPPKTSATIVQLGCAAPQTSTTGTVILVCSPPDPFWQKFLLTAPSIVSSVLALALGIIIYRYNRAKDQKTRKQSIDDDFWLRKVISPSALEPFVKNTNELLATLPEKCAGAEVVQNYWTAQAKVLNEASTAFRSIELIGAGLGVKVEKELETIDDVLANYCGNLQSHIENPTCLAPNRSEAKERIQAARLALYAAIAKHQATLGER